MVDRLGLVHKITVTGFNFGGQYLYDTPPQYYKDSLH